MMRPLPTSLVRNLLPLVHCKIGRRCSNIRHDSECFWLCLFFFSTFVEHLLRYCHRHVVSLEKMHACAQIPMYILELSHGPSGGVHPRARKQGVGSHQKYGICLNELCIVLCIDLFCSHVLCDWVDAAALEGIIMILQNMMMPSTAYLWNSIICLIVLAFCGSCPRYCRPVVFLLCNFRVLHGTWMTVVDVIICAGVQVSQVSTVWTSKKVSNVYTRHLLQPEDANEYTATTTIVTYESSELASQVSPWPWGWGFCRRDVLTMM